MDIATGILFPFFVGAKRVREVTAAHGSGWSGQDKCRKLCVWA
jgi:hypothetical protein